MSEAASPLRKRFRRSVSITNDSARVDEYTAGNSREPDEDTGLLGGESPNNTPRVASVLLLFHTTREIITSDRIYILLILSPFALPAALLQWPPTAQFLLCFLSVLPLTSLLAFATEELAVSLSQTLSGLLNATVGSTVELVIGVVALRRDEIGILQASMLGGIVVDVLLITSCCFVAGGVRHRQQSFNSTVVSIISSFLILGLVCLLMPTTLLSILSLFARTGVDITTLSRGSAIILLAIYFVYLLFQLKTHTELYDVDSGFPEADEEYETLLSPWVAGLVVLPVTALIFLCVENIFANIDAIVALQHIHISKTFVGFILLPFLANGTRLQIAAVLAYNDHMDLVLCLAMGSSLQIILFVMPVLVLLGWMAGRPVTLSFGIMETAVSFLSGLVMVKQLESGTTNYLGGVLGLGLYGIVVMAFYVLPEDINLA